MCKVLSRVPVTQDDKVNSSLTDNVGNSGRTVNGDKGRDQLNTSAYRQNLSV